MATRSSTHGFLPRNAMERKVPGLRDYSMPSEIKVYRANSDGTAGELLRIVPPKKQGGNKGEEKWIGY